MVTDNNIYLNTPCYLPAASGSMLCKACVVHVDPTSRFFDSTDVPIGTFLPTKV